VGRVEVSLWLERSCGRDGLARDRGEEEYSL